MDFSWTEEQVQFRQKVIQFAQQELLGNLIDLDSREEFNREGWQKCGEFGLIGLPIPRQYGGSEADILTTIYGLEALGYGCQDNGLIFAINAQIWACEIPILTFGSEAQKQKYLPQLCKGQLIGAHAASEPDVGSDIYSLKTTAQRQGDKYILNGTKNWVTNGPVADVNIVFANVAPEQGKWGIWIYCRKRLSWSSYEPQNF